jgi:hypothetical protein
MKRRLTVFAALALVLSVAAAATAAAETGKASDAKRLTGTVEAVDAAAGTLAVKGKKDSLSLMAGEKVDLGKIAVGDKVLVKYSGDTAWSVRKVAAKKTAKKRASARARSRKDAAPAPSAGGK